MKEEEKYKNVSQWSPETQEEYRLNAIGHGFYGVDLTVRGVDIAGESNWLDEHCNSTDGSYEPIYRLIVAEGEEGYFSIDWKARIACQNPFINPKESIGYRPIPFSKLIMGRYMVPSYFTMEERMAVSYNANPEFFTEKGLAELANKVGELVGESPMIMLWEQGYKIIGHLLYFGEKKAARNLHLLYGEGRSKYGPASDGLYFTAILTEEANKVPEIRSQYIS